jgi:hypothetical protein
MTRWAVLAVVALVIGAPALLPDPSDGFPVSSYPMFSYDRGRVAAVPTAVGIDADGTAHRLGPYAVGGGDEVILAAEAARLAVGAGAADAARFCREVAGRLPDDSGVEAVEVRTEVRDAVGDVDASEPPIEILVHATCDVP